MDALMRNDYPDENSGIHTAFSFAMPEGVESFILGQVAFLFHLFLIRSPNYTGFYSPAVFNPLSPSFLFFNDFITRRNWSAVLDTFIACLLSC